MFYLHFHPFFSYLPPRRLRSGALGEKKRELRISPAFQTDTGKLDALVPAPNTVLCPVGLHPARLVVSYQPSADTAPHRNVALPSARRANVISRSSPANKTVPHFPFPPFTTLRGFRRKKLVYVPSALTSRAGLNSSLVEDIPSPVADRAVTVMSARVYSTNLRVLSATFDKNLLPVRKLNPRHGDPS